MYKEHRNLVEYPSAGPYPPQMLRLTVFLISLEFFLHVLSLPLADKAAVDDAVGCPGTRQRLRLCPISFDPRGSDGSPANLQSNC
jgi:hypothetical protein